MKESVEKSLKEVARDLIALGGIPFFILVLVRVYLLNNPTYFSQFAVAGLIFIVIGIFLRTSIYAGLGLIALVFTNLYYQDLSFGIFSAIAYVLLLVSLVYLEKPKREIIKGFILGALATGIAYYLVMLLS